MSATIIAFPSVKSPVADSRPRGFCLDITVPDARGFVLLDTCVSMSLAVEFVNLVTLYAQTDGFEYPQVQDTGTPCITNYERPKFNYDMTQVEAPGHVLIDACVPAALAYAFRDLVDGISVPVTAS
jgi:hypothetical protein